MTSFREAPRWGALFDFDGVLVDTKALHQAAWDQVAAEHGFAHGPEDFARHFGSQNRRAIVDILRWTTDEAVVEQISVRKEVIYRGLLGTRPDLWILGSTELARALARSQVPCAIVSSSPRANIDSLLGDSALRCQFSAIVTAEDARVGKPDPEGFLLGAARLGVPPERCVVFEDAPAGIEAGRRGGMRVVALTTSHPASELSAAHLITDGLGPELLPQLEAWFPAPPRAGA